MAWLWWYRDYVQTLKEEIAWLRTELRREQGRADSAIRAQLALSTPAAPPVVRPSVAEVESPAVETPEALARRLLEDQSFMEVGR